MSIRCLVLRREEEEEEGGEERGGVKLVNVVKWVGNHVGFGLKAF